VVGVSVAGVSPATPTVERDDTRLGARVLIPATHSLRLSVDAVLDFRMVPGVMFGDVVGSRVVQPVMDVTLVPRPSRMRHNLFPKILQALLQ
jgi:hypothetical protein